MEHFNLDQSKMNTFSFFVFGVLLVSVQSARRSYEIKPTNYFQYANVPSDYEYEFGFNRGNPHHSVSRYEQSRGHTFHTKVKWNDDYGGYGEHIWDYNHGDSIYNKEPEYYYAKPNYEELVYKPTKGYKKNPAYYADPASAYRNIDVQSVSVPVYQAKVYKTTGYNPENAQQPEYPIDYSSFKRTFRY